MLIIFISAPWSSTVRKVLADFAVCDWRPYCKALCDVKSRQIKGNGRHMVKLNSARCGVTSGKPYTHMVVGCIRLWLYIF